MTYITKYVHKITEVQIPISYSNIREWPSDDNEISQLSGTRIQHEPGFEILIRYSNFKELEHDLSECNRLQTEVYLDKLAQSREIKLRKSVPAVAAAWDHYQLMLKLAG